MRKYEEKEVVKKEKVLISLVCNCCKEDILKMDTKLFYRVTTGHQLWGNDSMDSIEELEFCSYDCLTKHMESYYSDAKESMRYDIECENKRNL